MGIPILGANSASDAYDISNDMCNKCFCIMKTKSKMPDATCPIKKW